MKRIPFSVETCPKDISLIFWYTEDKGNWFEGIYKEDSEYGLGIESGDCCTQFIRAERILFFFDPTTLE